MEKILNFISFANLSLLILRPQLQFFKGVCELSKSQQLFFIGLKMCSVK